MIPAKSPFYRQALGAPHHAYSRVEVWKSGIMQDEFNQWDPSQLTRRPVFFTGSVRATLNSRVARTLTMNVPDWLYPYTDADLLDPFGSHLKCYRGVRYGDGSSDEFQIFNGPIKSVTPQSGNVAQVQAADLANEVILSGFFGQSTSSSNISVVEEFERLVSGGYPAAVFGTSDDFGAKVPPLSYDTDRGNALDALAKAVGGFWYALADGSFVLRRIPWTTKPTVQALRMGSGAEADLPYPGTVTEAYPQKSNDGVYNRVTVSVERTDGSTPVSATVADNDETSKTYIGGPYGVKSVVIKLNTPDNAATALMAAKAALARGKARSEPWKWNCVPDASIELGDPIELYWRGHYTLQLVAGFSIPLEANGAMAIDGRDYVDAGLDAFSVG